MAAEHEAEQMNLLRSIKQIWLLRIIKPFNPSIFYTFSQKQSGPKGLFHLLKHKFTQACRRSRVCERGQVTYSFQMRFSVCELKRLMTLRGTPALASTFSSSHLSWGPGQATPKISHNGVLITLN